MRYIPFKLVGSFSFYQSFMEVKEIIRSYNKFYISEKVELNFHYPTVFINDINLLIVFNSNGNSIRYFETKEDIYFKGVNLQKMNIIKIFDFFIGKDKSIYIDDEGSLISNKYGFIISKSNNVAENEVLLFSEEYLNEKEVSPDDIINYYLGSIG